MSHAVTITAGTGLLPLPARFPLSLGSELDDGILGFELSGPEGAPVVVVQGDLGRAARGRDAA